MNKIFQDPYVLRALPYLIGSANFMEDDNVGIEDVSGMYMYLFKSPLFRGRGSSIGSASAWHASGPEFDPHVRHILSWRHGHEKNSTAILPLPLIQEEQFSVTGEGMCTKYW